MGRTSNGAATNKGNNSAVNNVAFQTDLNPKKMSSTSETNDSLSSNTPVPSTASSIPTTSNNTPTSQEQQKQPNVMNIRSPATRIAPASPIKFDHPGPSSFNKKITEDDMAWLEDETTPLVGHKKYTRKPVRVKMLDHGGFVAKADTKVDYKVRRHIPFSEPVPSNLGAEQEAKPDAGISWQRSYTKTSLYFGLVMFSILGVLVREGLSTLSDHDMYAAFPRLYPNFIGCLIMGPVAMYKAFLISECYELYIAFGVGFCGSLTSFSSWQIEANQVLVGWPGVARENVNSVYDQIVASLTIQIIGVTIALGGLSLGMMGFKAMSDSDYAFDVTKPPRGAMQRRDFIIVICTILTISISLSVTAGVGAFNLFWVIVWAPVGAVLRYTLSRKYNQSWFPLGTLMANIGGTMLSGILLVLHHRFNLEGMEGSFAYGVAYGFCGCLTTVSTFALELRGLSSVPRRAFKYGALSVIIAQMVLVLICGSYIWKNDP
eukprot:m.206129 g.206129  ORF g.206129 m.206129 type:complete len:489 (-) comp32941_c0_seq1:35-1501(-)